MTEWEKFERMVSLKSETVELGKVDEIIDANKKASAQMEKAFKSVFAILSEIDKGIIYSSDAVKLAQSALAEIKKIDAQAKELGVTLSPDYNKAATNLYSIAELEGKQTLSDLQKAKNSF